MKDDILDHFDGYDEDIRIIPVKYFDQESEARIFGARLNQEGIPNYISNSNTTTALALGVGNIGLHIREQDLEAVLQIFKEIELEQKDYDAQITYHDASLEDIAYEKALNQPNIRFNWALALILILVVLLVIRIILRALGIVPSWWDFI